MIYWTPTPREADWAVCVDIYPYYSEVRARIEPPIVSRGWPASTMALRASRAHPPRPPSQVEHRQRRVKRQVWRGAA